MKLYGRRVQQCEIHWHQVEHGRSASTVCYGRGEAWDPAAGGMEEDTPAPLPMLSCLAATAAALQHLGTAAAGAPAAAFTTRLAPLCAACMAAIRPWKLRLQAAQTCEVMLGVLAAADGAGDAAARRAVLGGGGDVPGPLLACAGLKTEKVAQVRATLRQCCLPQREGGGVFWGGWASPGPSAPPSGRCHTDRLSLLRWVLRAVC